MKASELRIGNYVNNKGILDIVTCLEHVTFEDIINVRCQYYEVFIPEPIPLTEEWLLKFGFKVVKKHKHDFEEIFYGKSIIKNYPNHSEQLVISLPLAFAEIGEFNIDESYLMNIEIKHVHQLQNLYFALTGEELISKQKIK